MKVTLKKLFQNGSEKFMSLKEYLLILGGGCTQGKERR